MKTVSLKIFLLTVILAGGFPALAEEDPAARVLTLKESLQIAAERDVRLLLSEERVTQAVARIGQSRSSLFPQLGVSSSQKRMTRDLRSSGLSLSGDPLVGPFNTFDARAQLTQTIFDASAVARLKAAQSGSEFSRAEFRKTKEDVLSLVAVMFIDARRAAQRVEYAKTVVASEYKKLGVVQGRFQDGIASDLEVKQAQTSHDAAMRLQQQAITDATNTRLDLLAALGLDLEVPVQFVDEDGLIFPSPVAEVATTDLEELPDLQVAQQQLKVSQANRSAERSEYLPKISALADYGASGIKPSDSNETYTLGVQASLPIFDGGLRKNRIKEADSEVRASEASLNDTRIQSQAKIFKARELFTQAQSLVAEKNSQRNVAQQQLTLVQQRRQDGTATEIEWLEILAQDAEALDAENEARATLLTSQINWLHALGGIDRFLTEASREMISKE